MEFRKEQDMENDQLIKHAVELFQAIESGDIETIKRLIPDTLPVDIYTDDGITPLHFASWWGYFEIVKFLVSQGADVNRKDKLYYWTPLYYAAMNEQDEYDFRTYHTKKDQLEIVEYLLKNGADPNILSKTDQSALDLAMISSYPAVEEKIRDYGGKRSMFTSEWMPLDQFLQLNGKKEE
jgi:ankyrin repeat protein